jgi:large subunit ribosomal protein L33
MAGSKRKKVMMVSEAKLEDGQPTKTAYYTTKGERDPNKLKLKKFDPRAYNTETGKSGMHAVFNEKKVPK